MYRKCERKVKACWHQAFLHQNDRVHSTGIIFSVTSWCYTSSADPEGVPAQEPGLPQSRGNLRSGFRVRLSRLRTAGGLCTQALSKKTDRYLNTLLQDSRQHVFPVRRWCCFSPLSPIPPSCVSDISLLTSRRCDACFKGTDKLAMQLGVPPLNHLSFSLWSGIKTKDGGIKTILCQVMLTLCALP